MTRFSVPSKAFILGEYAVLASGQALVAALPPRFELAGGQEHGKALRALAPGSPARLLIEREVGAEAELAKRFLEMHFKDPHQGNGGFGGSTAEFALAYAAIHGTSAPVSTIWRAYREIQPQASGADLAAQWAGGTVICDPTTLSVERIRADRILKNLFVFSAAHQPGRKVRTHEHLAQAPAKREGMEQLAGSEVLSAGLKAARLEDFDAFARSINDYARLLRSLGLELPQTAEDRAALRDVRGICAVKGTGAMQADAVLAIGDPSLGRDEILKDLLRVARERDLRLVAGGGFGDYQDEIGIAG